MATEVPNEDHLDYTYKYTRKKYLHICPSSMLSDVILQVESD